jgi:integrase
MLTTALGWAVKNGHLRSSPAAGVERTAPTRRASKLKHWTPSQVGQFIESTTSDRSRAMWLLALNTGVRRGEMAALRWSDLDVEQGILRVHRNLVTVGYVVVEGTVKTEESDREIELDGAVMAELAAHRSRQAAERLKWGPGWQGDRHDPRMFTREDGADFHPAAISHLLKVATVRAGLPRIGVHGLRHTSAVLAMRAGVPPKVVQHRLGHASIAITMDTYSHVIEGMQREASSAISAVMGLGS